MGGVLVKEKHSRAGDGGIVPAELHKEATEAYAMSVLLLGQALPDVRDGLKPVHRRILTSPCDFHLFGGMETLDHLILILLPPCDTLSADWKY